MKISNTTTTTTTITTTTISLFLLLAVAVAGNPTAYDLLEAYNFPVGILPQGITSYDLNNSTGKFHVHINDSTCTFSLEGSYQLKYKSTISGRISKNRITELKGISVKVLFLWLNIVEVYRTGNDLGFSVGIASANFPVDQFFESPQCGCGLDCDGVGVGGIKGWLGMSEGLVSAL